MSFTIAGKLIAEIHLEETLYGVASAEVITAGPDVLAGAARLVVGDLPCEGTIIDGGVAGGRGRYQWTAGAGGWRTTIPARGYGATVLSRQAVIKDAADACGERVDNRLPVTRIGLPGNGGYVRALGPAWDVFKGNAAEESIPWHVRPDGITQVGERDALPAYTDGTLEASYPEDGRLVIVPNGQRIAGYMPGRTVGGVQIVTMRLDAVAGDSIRVNLFTRPLGDVSHDLGAQLTRIIEQRTGAHRFYGTYEYRVVAVNGTLYSAEPTDSTIGLPTIDNRDLRFGVPGVDASIKNGMIVYLQFANGSQAKALITGYERRSPDLHDHPGSLPARVLLDADRVDIGGHLKLAAQDGGLVTCTAISWLQSGPNAVTIGFSNPASPGDNTLTTITIASATPLTLTPAPPLATGVTLQGIIATPAQSKVYV